MVERIVIVHCVHVTQLDTKAKNCILFGLYTLYAHVCVCVIDWLQGEDGTIIFFLPDNYAMQNVTKIVSDFQVAVRKKGLLSWVELRNSHTATHIVERNEDEPK